jgi:uncharacterized membrane protein
MDTAIEPAIHVHKTDGTIMTFNEYENGLYFYDVAATQNSKTSNEVNAINTYSFILSVENNKKQFNNREVEGADHARTLHKRIGRPSQETFQNILSKNLIRNCPVTVDDAKRAIFIYGTDPGSLQGKPSRTPAEYVPTLTTIALPDELMLHHRTVTLCIDIFYVNKLMFFQSLSRRLKSARLATLQIGIIAHCLRKVYRLSICTKVAVLK